MPRASAEPHGHDRGGTTPSRSARPTAGRRGDQNCGVGDDEQGVVGDRAAFVRAFGDGWAAGAGVDAFLAHFDEQLIDPGIELWQPLVRPVRGRAGFDQAFRRVFTAMPDLTATVEGWRALPDGVEVTLAFRGTLGRTPVRFRSIDTITLREGRITRRTARLTLAPLLRASVTDRHAAAALWRLLRGDRVGGEQ